MPAPTADNLDTASKLSMGKRKSRPPGSCFEGPTIHFGGGELYHGLGTIYLKKLRESVDRIVQMDLSNGVTETCGSVASRAVQVAIAMRNRGIEENNIVLVNSKCHTDQTIVILATLFLGAIVAPIEPDYTHAELVSAIKQIRPQMCFCDSRPLPQVECALTELHMKVPVVIFGKKQRNLETFFDFLKEKDCDDFVPCPIPDPASHIAFILPTQGTTEPAKYVCVSHQSIHFQVLLLLEMCQRPSSVLSFYPTSWLVHIIILCMSFEGQMLRIISTATDCRSIVKLLHDLKIEMAFFQSRFAMQITEEVAIKDFDLSNLKAIVIGGVKSSYTDMKYLRASYPTIKVIQLYVTTEAGLISISPISEYSLVQDKQSSVGKLMPNMKMKVVDLITGQTLGHNMCGELLVSSNGVMLGYLRDKENTKATFQKSYIKTGDVAHYDKEGWLYLHGRLPDIIRIHEQPPLFPYDLEDVILTHPWVKDVCVISDVEHMIACVVKRPNTTLKPETLAHFMSEKLAEHEVPKKIILLDSFPLTPCGKIRRNILREKYLKVSIEYSKSSLLQPASASLKSNKTG